MNHKNLIAVAVTSLAMFGLAACGDEVTEVTNVTEKANISTLEAGKKLSKVKCGSENEGEMLFVKDSAEVFFCDGKKWQSLKGEQGEQGEPGDPGKPGDPGEKGDDGKSCSVKQKEGVTTISCETEDGVVSYKVMDGAAGESCTAKAAKEEETGEDGYQIVCGDEVMGFVLSGKSNNSCSVSKDGAVATITCGSDDSKTTVSITDGDVSKIKTGCNMEDDGKGTITISCVNGEKKTVANVFKGICGNQPFDPDSVFCDYRDLRMYHFVTIGVRSKMVWMLENMRFPVNEGTESWLPNNSEEDGELYGHLYTLGGAKSACPGGWHLPDTTEWNDLYKILGGSGVNDASQSLSEKIISKEGWSGSGLNWVDEKTVNNEGLSLMPAGQVSPQDQVGARSFKEFGKSAFYWTSRSNHETSDNTYYAIQMVQTIESLHEKVSLKTWFMNYDKDYGFSVRCVKD